MPSGAREGSATVWHSTSSTGSSAATAPRRNSGATRSMRATEPGVPLAEAVKVPPSTANFGGSVVA